MYFPLFLIYIAGGLSVTVLLFLWALKSGQFSDQQRARFLPLETDDEVAATGSSRISRYEVYALAFLACGGLAATAGMLVYALFFS